MWTRRVKWRLVVAVLFLALVTVLLLVLPGGVLG